VDLMPTMVVQSCEENKIQRNEGFREFTEALFCIEALAMGVEISVENMIGKCDIGERENGVDHVGQYIQQVFRYVFIDGVGLLGKQLQDMSIESTLQMQGLKDLQHFKNQSQQELQQQRQQELLVLASLNRISHIDNTNHSGCNDLDLSTYFDTSFNHILEVLLHTRSTRSLTISNSSISSSNENSCVQNTSSTISKADSNIEHNLMTKSIMGHPRDMAFKACEQERSISAWVKDDNLEALYINLLTTPVPIGSKHLLKSQNQKTASTMDATSDPIRKKRKIEESTEAVASKFVYYPLVKSKLSLLSDEDQLLVITAISTKLHDFIQKLPSKSDRRKDNCNDDKDSKSNSNSKNGYSDRDKNCGKDVENSSYSSDSRNISDMHNSHKESIIMYRALSSAAQCSVQAILIIAEVISNTTFRAIKEVTSTDYDTIFNCVGNISRTMVSLLTDAFPEESSLLSNACGESTAAALRLALEGSGRDDHHDCSNQTNLDSDITGYNICSNNMSFEQILMRIQVLSEINRYSVTRKSMGKSEGKILSPVTYCSKTQTIMVLNSNEGTGKVIGGFSARTGRGSIMGGSRTPESINNNDLDVDIGLKNDRKRRIGLIQDQENPLHVVSLSYVLAKIFALAVCDLWDIHFHNLIERMKSNLFESSSSIPGCKGHTSSSKHDDSESWQDSEEPGGEDDCLEREVVGNKRLNKDKDSYLLEGFIDCLVSLRALTVAITSCLHYGKDEDDESKTKMMKRLCEVSLDMDSSYKSILFNNVSNMDNDEGLEYTSEGYNRKTNGDDLNGQKKEEKSLFSGQGLLKCGQYLCISIMDQSGRREVQGNALSDINLGVLGNYFFQNASTIPSTLDKNVEVYDLDSSSKLTVKLAALSKVLNYSALLCPQVIDCFVVFSHYYCY
jgi:hypothetical protein